jgi:hypothetical protein
MIKIKTNIGTVIEVSIGKLHSLADTDKMVRTAATSVLGVMKKRIHEDGKDANGNQIGTYSKGYMAVRTGVFGNAAKVTKGKNKGKLKDAGVFSRGANKGSSRPRYNRSSDTKVIASLTRQMENDMKVVAIPNGYGIGYSNRDNYQKSQWVEETYKKEGKIFSLSNEEKDIVIAIAQQHKADAIS